MRIFILTVNNIFIRVLDDEESITLFISITMLRETDTIKWNIYLHIN